MRYARRVMLMVALSACGRIGFGPGESGDATVVADAIMPVPFTLPTGAGLVRGVDELADGSIAIAGVITESVQLGDTLTHAGGRDALIALVAADGNIRWARSYGSSADEEAHTVIIGPGDIIYVGGENEGSVDFGDGPFAAMGQDAFVASFTVDGNLRWARALTGDRPAGANGTDLISSLAACENGDVIVGGRVAGVVDFGLGPTPAGGLFDAFVARLAADDGRTIWAKRWGAVAYTRTMGVATGPGDAVYVSGEFEGPIDFGGGSINDDGIQDAFLVALDGDGEYSWATKYGGTGFDWAYRVAVAGDVVALGGFYSSDPLVPGVPPATGSRDAIVIGYDAQTGARQWTRTYGDTACDAVFALHAASGELLAGGIFTGTIDVGTGPLTSDGTDSVLFAIDPSSGATTWSTEIGGAGVETLLGISGSRARGVYLVGATEATLSSCNENEGKGYLRRIEP